MITNEARLFFTKKIIAARHAANVGHGVVLIDDGGGPDNTTVVLIRIA